MVVVVFPLEGGHARLGGANSQESLDLDCISSSVSATVRANNSLERELARDLAHSKCSSFGQVRMYIGG